MEIGKWKSLYPAPERASTPFRLRPDSNRPKNCHMFCVQSGLLGRQESLCTVHGGVHLHTANADDERTILCVTTGNTWGLGTCLRREYVEGC